MKFPIGSPAKQSKKETLLWLQTINLMILSLVLISGCNRTADLRSGGLFSYRPKAYEKRIREREKSLLELKQLQERLDQEKMSAEVSGFSTDITKVHGSELNTTVISSRLDRYEGIIIEEQELINNLKKRIEEREKEITRRFPQFPWPPPATSAQEKLSSKFFKETPNKIKFFKDIDKKINSALNSAGYVEKNYYAIPSGFAMVTRLERIYPDGTPHSDRWAMSVRPLQTFSLRAYLRALFTANRGYYRIIVFIVTRYAFTQSDEQVPREKAIAWLKEGLDRLPTIIAEQEYSEEYAVTALIYEFEQTKSGQEATLKIPGRLTGKDHLKKAEVESLLEK